MGGSEPVDPNAAQPDWTFAFVFVGVIIPLGWAIAVVFSMIESRKAKRAKEHSKVATAVLRSSYQRLWFPWRDAVRSSEPESANARAWEAQTVQDQVEEAKRESRRQVEEERAAARQQARHHSQQAWTQPCEQPQPRMPVGEQPTVAKPWAPLGAPPSPTEVHFHGEGPEDAGSDISSTGAVAHDNVSGGSGLFEAIRAHNEAHQSRTGPGRCLTGGVRRSEPDLEAGSGPDGEDSRFGI